MKKKLFTVIWSKRGRDEYGVEPGDNPIISIDPDNHQISFNDSDKKIGRPKIRWAEVYPFFDTEKEAEAFRQGNTDWQVVSIDVVIPDPTN